MWARPMVQGGSLLSYEYTMWEGWDEYDRSNINEEIWNKYFELARFTSLYLSPCETFKL
jgi:hypothetical protein